ncbi:hypothetical protein [Caminibacter sp.]
MNKWIKILIIVCTVAVLSVIGVVIFLKSSLGKEYMASLLKEKAKILKNFEMQNFNYDFNAFSAIFKKGSNKILLYGDFFPFNGVYEVHMNNLTELTPYLRGKFSSMGKFSYSSYLNISGNALFARGYGTLRFQCIDKCIGILSGLDFNTSKLLYMLKIDIPNLHFYGTNNLNLLVKNNFSEATFLYKGNAYFNGIMLDNIKISGFTKIKDKNNYSVNLKILSSKLKAELNIEKNNSVYIQGNGRINLSLLKLYTLYPLRTIDDFHFLYNGGMFKFYNKCISGISSQGKFSIGINNMNSNLFFKILGIKKFFDGLINGNINIYKNNGNFDLISTDIKMLMNSKILEYIKNYFHIKNINFNILLMKGNFDSSKIIFNIIAKNKSQNIFISIQNGIYFYNGDYRFKLEVIKNFNKYVFLIKNGKISVKQIFKVNPNAEKILVY